MTRNRAEILEIMRVFARENPNPQCELNFVNPYTLLVAVVLSAQSTDKGVNKATEALFKVADTPQKMLDLGEEKLNEYIKTIGLFNNKAKNIIALSRQLVNDFGGEVPADRDTLTELAGVGRKTANVMLSVVWKRAAMAVDTHVFRVSERIGLTTGAKTPRQTEEELVKNIPQEQIPLAHHWLILHGRYVCKARRPDCPNCGIADWCRWYSKHS